MALHNAAKRGDIDTVKRIISTDHKALESIDRTGKTALLRACKYGHAPVVQYLLEQGASMKPTCSGRTCLHLAVVGGHTRTVHVLLVCGGQFMLDKVDPQGRRPIDLLHGSATKELRSILENASREVKKAKDEAADVVPSTPPQQENVRPKPPSMSMSMDAGSTAWMAGPLGLDPIREERSSSDTQRSSICAAQNQQFVSPGNTRRSLQVLPVGQTSTGAANFEKFWEASSVSNHRSSVGGYQPMFYDLEKDKPVEDPRCFQPVNLRNVQAIETGSRASFDAGRRPSFDAGRRQSVDTGHGRTSFDVSGSRGGHRGSMDTRGRPDPRSLFDPKTGQVVDPNAQAAAAAVTFAVQARASFEASRISIDQINSSNTSRKRASVDMFGAGNGGPSRLSSSNFGSGKPAVFVRRDWS